MLSACRSAGRSRKRTPCRTPARSSCCRSGSRTTRSWCRRCWRSRRGEDAFRARLLTIDRKTRLSRPYTVPSHKPLFRNHIRGRGGGKPLQSAVSHATISAGWAAVAVRHPADVLYEIGRHLADAVAAQGQGADDPAEALFDGADDLIVAADRGEQIRDIVGRLLRHLPPFPPAAERVE